MAADNGWTEDKIKKIIVDKFEESLELEYKSKDALGKAKDWKKELSKDVSCFANSAGGLIIYGISEKDHLPDKIQGIDPRQFDKERLENLILSLIHPRIEAVIHSVKLDKSSPGKIVYVVEVPKGLTAYQASDYRYYKRHNFQVMPMEDYEVKDVMGRIKYPILQPYFWVVGDKNRNDSLFLQAKVKNVGTVAAKNFVVEFVLPMHLCKPQGFRSPNDNKVRKQGNVDFRILRFRSSFAVDNPVLFPGDEYEIMDQNSAWVMFKFDTDLINNFSLSWRVFADDAPQREGSIELKYVYGANDESQAEEIFRRLSIESPNP